MLSLLRALYIITTIMTDKPDYHVVHCMLRGTVIDEAYMQYS